MNKRWIGFLLAALGLALVLRAPAPGQAPAAADYDVLIKNGRILDGGLGPTLLADVAVKRDTIVRIGRSLGGRAARTIDARGLLVVPGFIDLHSHVTREGLDDGVIFNEGRSGLNFLLQGVTSVIAGQCGSSGWPEFERPADMMDLLTREGIGFNMALLVGHASVRQIVMGRENRAPTPDEMSRMKTLVREAMEQGASGLSSGLYYVPGIYAKTEEVIELAKEIAAYGGIYHTHIRNEGNGLPDSLREAILIGERAGVATHISHLKVLGRANWGSAGTATGLIEDARRRGLAVTADQYPYRFSSISPYQSPVPRSAWLGRDRSVWLEAGDVEGMFDLLRGEDLVRLYEKITPFTPLSPGHRAFLKNLPRQRLAALVAQGLVDVRRFQGPENARARALFQERLRDPQEERWIREEIRRSVDAVGPENLIVGICPERRIEGKSVREVAALKGLAVEDTMIQLQLMGAQCVPLRISEDDIATIMKKDYVGTGSDGTTPFYGIGRPHIRSYSTFIDKIRVYALEKKTISLAQAVRSQTSLPAQVMNWKDRGWLREGFKADIAVLDLEGLRAPASLSDPHQYAEGVRYLLVNGIVTVDGGIWTGKLAGRIIKPRTP